MLSSMGPFFVFSLNSVIVLAMVVRVAAGQHISKGPSVWTEPFVDGVGGWKVYRIPSLIVTSNGDLLLFVEGPFSSYCGGGLQLFQSYAHFFYCSGISRWCVHTCVRMQNIPH